DGGHCGGAREVSGRSDCFTRKVSAIERSSSGTGGFGERTGLLGAAGKTFRRPRSFFMALEYPPTWHRQVPVSQGLSFLSQCRRVYLVPSSIGATIRGEMAERLGALRQRGAAHAPKSRRRDHPLLRTCTTGSRKG